LCVLEGECCVCSLVNDSIVVEDFSIDVHLLTTLPGIATRSGGELPVSASRLSGVASALDLLLFVCERIGPGSRESRALGSLYSKLVGAITPVLDSLLPRVRDGLLERGRPGLRRSSHDDVVDFPDFRSVAFHEAIAEIDLSAPPPTVIQASLPKSPVVEKGPPRPVPVSPIPVPASNPNRRMSSQNRSRQQAARRGLLGHSSRPVVEKGPLRPVELSVRPIPVPAPDPTRRMSSRNR
jgi:hypothetical protein